MTSPPNIPLCPSLIALSCLSCSIIICSSPNTSAYGRPSNNTDVVTTHSALPPQVTTLPVADEVRAIAVESLARVSGGIMSFRAAMRSLIVSSGGAEGRSSSEISLSVGF